jgi:F0F1-type ATP synthase membrane subunit b/b'
MHELIAPTVNLLILVSLLFYYLKEPVRAHVHGRHLTLREELDRVRELLKKAKAQHEEFTAKLSAIGAETTALREQATLDAQAAKQRLLSDAQRLSGNIVSDAHNAARGLYEELKTQLSSEMGARIITRAEVLLRSRLTGDDKMRIRQEFSQQVETVQ